MKVGNLVGGLEVVDVKQVNKLNLIQFLKEVDSYLQQGYQIDVKSGRQVGLVLQCKMFKTESASNIDVDSTDVGSVGEQIPTERDVGVSSKEDTTVHDEATAYKERLEKEGFSTEWVDGDKKEVEVGASTPAEESVVTEKQRQDQLTKSVEEAKEALSTFTTPEQNDATVVKKTTTRSKKTAQ